MKIYLILLSLFLLQIQSCKDIEKAKDKFEKPNIIFILTDDLGYGDIGVLYQNERKRRDDHSKPWLSTPNLDKMAQEGIILSNHYVAAPVCAPSRASFLSGLSQGHANVRDNQFDKALSDNHTVSNVLKRIGYRTAAIGKWGLQGDDRWDTNGSTWPAKPTNRGFDYFYGYMTHVAGHEHYPKEKLYRTKSSVWDNDQNVTEHLDKCYTTDLWTAKAKQWISETVSQNEAPFFMYLAYDTPHAVLELPTQAYPNGMGLNGGLQWQGNNGNMINTANGEPDTFIHPDYENMTYDHDKNPDTEAIDWPETYKRYATSVRRIDDCIGDILQLLKDLGIDENTLVVFTSDNGPSRESYLPEDYEPNHPTFFDSYGPFNGIKRDVLEGGLRVPLIARWPLTIPKNTVNPSPSITYDWLPTFLDAAGFPPPANSDGVSLLPSLKGENQDNSQIYIEYQVSGKTPDYETFHENNRNRNRKQMQMVRHENLVGVRYNITDPHVDFEIYDIVNDMQQANNLARADSLFQLQENLKMRILRQRRVDSAAPRPYDSLLIPSLSSKNQVLKGLKWRSYEGHYPWLPNLNTLVSIDSGELLEIVNFDFSARKESLYLLEGFIDIPENGIYQFNFQTSDKAFVRLHEAILFDADFNYLPNEWLKTSIPLEKGLHPIKIYLQNRDKNQNPFSLNWKSEVGNNSQTFRNDFYIERSN